MKVSVIIPTRNEGDELSATVSSAIAAGADEVIVIDDASEDGSATKLRGEEKVTVIHHPRPLGCGRCRIVGAAAATGEVLVFSDAHVRFDTNLAELAETSQLHNAIAAAACRPKDGGNWTGYGARLAKDLKPGYQVKWIVQRPASRVTHRAALLGSVYAFPRKVYECIGWFPTICWGYDEQVLSLKALMLGVPLVLDRNVVTRHGFRKQFPYKVDAADTQINRILAHRILFEPDTWAKEAGEFKAAYPLAWKKIEPVLEADDTKQLHADFQAARQRTDAEVAEIIRTNKVSPLPQPSSCCGKAKHIAQGFAQLVVDRVSGKELGTQATLRLMQCSICPHRTWLSISKWGLGIWTGGDLPTNHKYSEGSAMWCSKCKCSLEAKVRVPDERCTEGFWRKEAK